MQQREILFRGKSLYTDEGWRYGLLSRLTPITCWINEQGKSPQHECDPETLGQYTGLKDKNGVNIFEGDVILFAKETNLTPDCTMVGPGVVTWHEAGFQVLTGGCYTPMIHKRFEIIGNIHDQPELLEQ